MRIAVIGDVHGLWHHEDVEQFDRSDVDLVLFVGDLPGRGHRDLLAVARRIACLRKPALVFPGNHDGTTRGHVLLEALVPGRTSLGSRGQQRHLEALRAALDPVPLAGYSLHLFDDVAVIAGRPHGMDGRGLTFRGCLAERHGVTDLEGSIERMQALVERAGDRTLVFLAHNGPAGLGSEPASPWALRRLQRDNGDRDLRAAVDAARARGCRVAAVVGGHMHHRGNRRWRVRRDGVLYVNAARVPRIELRGGRTCRHHVRLEVNEGRASAVEVWE